ncbi:hypothetical protein BH18GEM1_BH18GEM1_07300 [soil metagenome]
MGGDRAVRRGPGRGCLDTGAIALFALLLGAFAASTLLRHADPGGRADTRAHDPLVREPPPVARARIRIEVRNGSGVRGAAERTTALLRREGFDVVDFGNAERFDYDHTVVIDRSGKTGFASEVAVALQGVPIRTAPDSTLYLDVTVLIGGDLPAVLGERQDRSRASRGGWRGWLKRVRH